jgi:ribosomal protein S27E
MVETRLLRPAKRLVEARCPGCHHVRKIYDNSNRGVAHCMYCGADFEWKDGEIADTGGLAVAAPSHIPGLADIALATR